MARVGIPEAQKSDAEVRCLSLCKLTSRSSGARAIEDTRAVDGCLKGVQEAQGTVPRSADAGYRTAGFGLTFPLFPFLLFGVEVDTPHHCMSGAYKA